MNERNLPDLLGDNGCWDKARRDELLLLFAREVYGESPMDGFETVWTVSEEEHLDGLGTRRVVDITVKAPRGNHTFPLYLYLPEETGCPAPVILYIGNRPHSQSPVTFPPDLTIDKLLEVMRQTDVSPFGVEVSPEVLEHANLSIPPLDLSHILDTGDGEWPVEALLKRGFATAAFYTEDLEPDCCTDLKQGIICKFDDVDHRGPDRWGVIAAWAFGASRAIDYLVAEPRIDRKQIAVAGHSRGGKTALWCTANDSRVTCCYANNSGCTGAAVSRGKHGEGLLQINTLFPYWFCGNYKHYQDQVEMLPVDQHMLLALAAPRPLYLASATKDAWADPESEFLSAMEASPAYEALGVPGLTCKTLPVPGVPSHSGTIGYHTREGGHALTEGDWMLFCDFWETRNASAADKTRETTA